MAVDGFLVGFWVAALTAGWVGLAAGSVTFIVGFCVVVPKPKQNFVERWTEEISNKTVQILLRSKVSECLKNQTKVKLLISNKI